MKKYFVFLSLILGIVFSPAWAMDLSEAKNQGLIGETPRGYLEPVKGPNEQVMKLVKDINGKRRQQYKKIAKENNTSLESVEAMAGEKAMNLTKKGHFIKMNGKWVKK